MARASERSVADALISYDDAFSDESVVRGRDIKFTTPESFGGYELTYRSGVRISSRVDGAQPVGLELQDVARAICTGRRGVSHARLVLEARQEGAVT